MNSRNHNFTSIGDAKSLSSSMSSQADAAPTFHTVLEAVRRQVGADCFEPHRRALAEELCRIIAEVLLLPQNARIRIAGNDMPAAMAAEVYGHLDYEHIDLVMENFSRMTYRITAKKTYLRTALYNAVFECESHWQNQAAKALAGK